jgi:hypothetical protein
MGVEPGYSMDDDSLIGRKATVADQTESSRYRQESPGWVRCDPLCSHNLGYPAGEGSCSLGYHPSQGDPATEALVRSEGFFLYWSRKRLPMPQDEARRYPYAEGEVMICSHVCTPHLDASGKCPHHNDKAMWSTKTRTEAP